MADNEKNEPKDDKTAKSENLDNGEKQNNKGSDNTLAWVLGALAVFIFVCVFIGGFGLIAYNKNHRNDLNAGMIGFIDNNTRKFGHREFMGGGMMGSTNQVAISGVVTAVNGQSFIIAGNGTTNTIQTNSSTKYSGATKVSVNDSVTVAGSTDNSAFTATQVVIRNQ